MTKARDLANIIAGGFTTSDLPTLTASEIPNLDASKITSGTFSDARIAASNVSQHAQSFDDNKLVNDISTLALRQASDENKSAYNTNSSSVDVFQDATGIDTTTNASRNTNEYVSTVGSATGTSNVGGSDTNFGDGNLRWSSTGAFRDTYGTGNDIGYDGSSYNYNQLSSSDGQDASHTPDSADALIVGNGKIWFDNVNNDMGSGVGDNNGSEYYEWGLLNGYTNVNNTHALGQPSGVTGIICAMPSYQRDMKIMKLNGGSSTYLGVIRGSEQTSSSSIITMARMDGRIYILFDDVLKFTVDASDFNDTSNLATIWSWGRGTGARAYMNAGYRANMTQIIGVPYSTVNATGNFTGTTITAPSSVSSMGAIITYQDQAGTNALNTDIVLQLSADGGSNYSTATLTALPDFSTGIKMAKVNDLSVTAGTSLKYKLSFANQASGTKEARIRGVSLQY